MPRVTVQPAGVEAVVAVPGGLDPTEQGDELVAVGERADEDRGPQRVGETAGGLGPGGAVGR